MSEVSTITNWDQLPLLLETKHMMALYGIDNRKTISQWARSGHIPPPTFSVGKTTRRWDREIVRQHLERRQRM